MPPVPAHLPPAALWTVALLVASSAFGAHAFADDSEDNKPKKSCVEVSTQTPYIPYGYDHIVVLKSTCKKTMHCTVKTNVNPSPQSVDLAPGEEKSLVTFKASPSREFVPTVTCKE